MRWCVHVHCSELLKHPNTLPVITMKDPNQTFNDSSLIGNVGQAIELAIVLPHSLLVKLNLCTSQPLTEEKIPTMR